MSKKKILFCLGSFGHGGAERVISNLTNSLNKEYSINIILTKKNNLSYSLPLNVKVDVLDDLKQSNNFLLKNIKRIKKLNKFIKEINPDIIISFLPEPSYRVLFLKPIHKIPVIVSVRNDPKIEYKSKINKFIMKKLYKKADGFVFQTEEAKSYFPKYIQDKSVIILNPLSKDFITQEYTGKREKKIVNVGRLAPQKNQKLLIDAFNNLSDKFLEYKLLIYGIGPLHDELEEYIKKLNLSDRVKLMGEIDNVQNEIVDANLFVLSSDYEGLPNSLIEAMTLGLPVISTDCPCGGPRTLIKNNQNGILVPVGNCEELTKKMEEILSNPKLATNLAKEARKVINLTNPDVINKKWLNYIKKIMKK
ncbi:MAG: glycosyltransferase family 4 protein [Bacilli bacterium]|nr:glycosyltransferase family 4 protein [Bacilli bacterium]